MNTNEHEIEKLIQQGESLTLEFKSDLKCLPDRELVAAVVSLANTEGGDLLLGVEDDGTPTGLHANHLNVSGISSLIANRTNPAISVRVELCENQGKTVARIIVPKSRQLVSTSDGLLVRRRLKLDGTPEAVPFYPHEFIQRQSSMGLVDPSAMVLEEIDASQLDPLQRLRIRNAIKKYGGEQSLLALADNELDGALGLCREVNGARRPNVAGLLLLGTEDLLRQNLPAYEVAFQVLQGTHVKVNEFFHKPLLETFEEVKLLFKARVEEEEIQVGLFRVPIPNYDRRAFREAFVNALVHRDFSRLGAVHAKITGDGLSISNPGGFVEGVTLEDKLGNMPIDSLIILSCLREERRLTTADLAPSVQKPEANVRATLEKLVETGFLEPHGTGRGRTYTLSVKLYQNAGKKSEYIRQAGFSSIQQEQMVLNYIDKHGSIKRADVMDLCHLNGPQAYRLLKKLTVKKLIKKTGEKKHAVYTR